jgi:AcrR family transcriptional regulator
MSGTVSYTSARRARNRARLEAVEAPSDPSPRLASVGATRDRIVTAAIEAFGEKSYAATTIDDIAKRAGLTRQSFYNYFEGRLPLAEAILEKAIERNAAVFQSIAVTPDPSLDAVMAWIDRLIELYRENETIFSVLGQIVANEPIFSGRTWASSATLIRHWGQVIPAFRLASSGRPEDHEAQIGAHLLVDELQRFCAKIEFHRWPVDRETAVRVMARQFLAFIHAYPG